MRHIRRLAVLSTVAFIVRFAQIPAADSFSTAEIQACIVAAPGERGEQYTMAFCYDFFKPARRDLVEKLPRSRRSSSY